MLRHIDFDHQIEAMHPSWMHGSSQEKGTTMDVLKLQSLPEAPQAAAALEIWGASSFISVFNHCQQDQRCQSN